MSRLALRHGEFQVRRGPYKLLLLFCTNHRRAISPFSTAWAGTLRWSGTARQSQDVLVLPPRSALPAPSLLAPAQAHPVRGAEHTGNALPAIACGGEQGLRHPGGSAGFWCRAGTVNDRQCLEKLPALNEQAEVFLKLLLTIN